MYQLSIKIKFDAMDDPDARVVAKEAIQAINESLADFDEFGSPEVKLQKTFVNGSPEGVQL